MWVAPGVLDNDSDPDDPLIAYTFNIRSQFFGGAGTLIGLGFDYFRQLLYYYPRLDNNIYVHDRLGAAIMTFNVAGLGVEKLDLDIVPEAFQLGGQTMRQGKLMVINGQNGNATIQVVDPESGVLEGQLNTGFGNGQVVGGAYNPVTKTIFLVQNNMGGAEANRVAEIDPEDGSVIGLIDLNDPSIDFDVMYGDLDVDPVSGHLFLISNTENTLAQLTPQGQFIRKITLPNIVDPSGIAISHTRDRVWVSNLNGNVYETRSGHCDATTTES